MIPASVSHVVTIFIGAVLPAYASFKAIHNEDGRSQLVLLVYWITFALFAALELVADTGLFWLPLYGEMKLVLLLWLLSPQYRGAVMLYRLVIHDWLRRHQQRIDGYLEWAQAHGHLWMVGTVAKVLLSALYTVGRAAWMVVPHHPADSLTQRQPPTQPSGRVPERGFTGIPLTVSDSPSEVKPVAPPIADSPPPPPLDTVQVAALSAGLEESCRMLLRSTMAAQAGNQLLATLHEHSSVTLAHCGSPSPPPVAPRSRTSRDGVSATHSQSVEKAVHRRRSDHAVKRKSRSTSSLLSRATARSQQASISKKLLWRGKMDHIHEMVAFIEHLPRDRTAAGGGGVRPLNEERAPQKRVTILPHSGICEFD